MTLNCALVKLMYNTRKNAIRLGSNASVPDKTGSYFRPNAQFGQEGLQSVSFCFLDLLYIYLTKSQQPQICVITA
jgi:hypothetical protein